MTIRAVLFDFDDTLTHPGGLDYQAIRRDIGCPEGESILDYLDGIEDPKKRARAGRILDGHEMASAAAAAPAAGAEILIEWLQARGLKKGILTRNTRSAVLRSLENFDRTSAKDFDVIVTRDSDVAVKPEPDGVYLAAEHLEVEPSELFVVGDYVYDIEAGTAAGAVTVFIASRKDRSFTPPPSAYSITALAEIQGIVERHR